MENLKKEKRIGKAVKKFLMDISAGVLGGLIVDYFDRQHTKKAQEKVKIQSWNVLEHGDVLVDLDNGIERMRLVYYDNAVHMLLERDGYFADVVSFENGKEELIWTKQKF